jgi:ATP-dependent protease ClpP protease subunit
VLLDDPLDIPLSNLKASRPRVKKTSITARPHQSLEYLGSVCNATNERLFVEFKKRIAKAPQEEIYLTVTSAGGPTGIGMCFYETMRCILKPKLITIGIGDVDSSGIIIFLSGERRLISARTTLLLHLAGRRFDPNARFTAGEIEAMAREDRLKDMQYASVVAESSLFLTSSDVLTMMEKNTVLSPEELLKFGLAHEILS